MFSLYSEKDVVSISDFEERHSRLLANILLQELEVPNLARAAGDYVKILRISMLDKYFTESKKELEEAVRLGATERQNEILSKINWIIQQKKSLAP